MKFEPSKDYEGLLKQARALHSLVNTLESIQSHQSGKINDLYVELLRVGQKELEAHRITNEQLTNQILELEDEVAILKKALRSCIEESITWEDYSLMGEDDYVKIVEEYINNAKEVEC